MKFKWTEESSSNIFSNAIVLIIAITFYFILKNAGELLSFVGNVFSILSPFIIGFVIAYLLLRPVKNLNTLLDQFLFKKAKNHHSINKGISITIVLVLVLVLLSLVIYSIIPQLIDSVARLARNADSYIKTVTDFINGLAVRLHLNSDIFSGIIGSSQELFKKLITYISSSLPRFLDFSVSIGSGISNFIIGFIISIYILNGADLFLAQIKKLCTALLPKKFLSRVSVLMKTMHDTFGNYITGKILDCLIVGTICFLVMTIFGMEYALLISMFVALTNFIPFIGPFIGAIPSAFILLMVQPSKVLWFILMIVVLQQLDGNFIGPKIVGKSTGLSSFWVIFSILLGGGLFGIGGVLLAVPTFSVVYLVVKNLIEKKLREKNLPTETAEYYK